MPIHHPVSGKTVGVIDLTCWRKDADPLLIALAKTHGRPDHARPCWPTAARRELQLLQEYLRACRRTGGIVLALGNDVVMMNDHARQVLDPGDQAALLGHAAEALASGRPGRGRASTCPPASVARMYCRPGRRAAAPAPAAWSTSS